MSLPAGPEYIIDGKNNIFNINTANISQGSTAIVYLSSVAYPNSLFSIRDFTGSLSPSTPITLNTMSTTSFSYSNSSVSLSHPFDSVLVTNNMPYWTLQNTYAYKSPSEILETYISSGQINVQSLTAGHLSTSSINYSLTSYSTLFCSSINDIRFPADITNFFLSTLTLKEDFSFNISSNMNSTGQVYGSATLRGGVCFIPRYPRSDDSLLFLQRTSTNLSMKLGHLNYTFLNFVDYRTIPDWGLFIYSSNAEGSNGNYIQEIETYDNSSFDWIYFNQKTNDLLPPNPFILVSPSNISPTYTTEYPPVFEKNYFQFGKYVWAEDSGGNYNWAGSEVGTYFNFGAQVISNNSVGFSFKTKVCWYPMSFGNSAGTIFDFAAGMSRITCYNEYYGPGYLQFTYYNAIWVPFTVTYNDPSKINSYLVTTIAATYDPTIGVGGQVNLWINGEKVITENMDEKGVDAPYTTTYVGRNSYDPSNSALKARMYYFAAYNRVLTDEEAAAVL